jgi:hypothetical protein
MEHEYKFNLDIRQAQHTITELEKKLKNFRRRNILPLNREIRDSQKSLASLKCSLLDQNNTKKAMVRLGSGDKNSIEADIDDTSCKIVNTEVNLKILLTQLQQHQQPEEIILQEIRRCRQNIQTRKQWWRARLGAALPEHCNAVRLADIEKELSTPDFTEFMKEFTNLVSEPALLPPVNLEMVLAMKTKQRNELHKKLTKL